MKGKDRDAEEGAVGRGQSAEREARPSTRAASGMPLREPPVTAGVTEDERFLESAQDLFQGDPSFALSKDAWRVFRIIGEFVEGFDALAGAGRAGRIEEARAAGGVASAERPRHSASPE